MIYIIFKRNEIISQSQDVQMKMKLKIFQIFVARLKPPLGIYIPSFTMGCQRFRSTDDTLTKCDKDSAENETRVKNNEGNHEIIKALTAVDSDDTHHIPIHSMKKLANIESLHLIDKNVAENFASMIATDLRKTNSVVFEVNPGFGYLTEQLLAAGVSRLQLYENDENFTKYLTPLIAKYPNRLSVEILDFFALSKLAYMDSTKKQDIMTSIFRPAEKREWADDPSISIIGALTRKKFLGFLRYSLISGHLSDHGRVALYVAILPSLSSALGDTRTMLLFHKPNNIMLQSLFTCERLGTLPRRAFTPLPRKDAKKKRITRYFNQNDELMHVVKLVPKPDFFNDDFTKRDADAFFYFLLIHLKPGGLRVIPSLEKWIPNCGPRLIKRNFNIFTKFNELSSLELLNLFKAFKSWPEYENSAFLSLVEDMKSRNFL